MGPFTKMLAALCPILGLLPGWAGTSGAQQNPVTAIDALPEPDTTMPKHAAAANARLLKVYLMGFALDETHKPHMTTLQRYVRTADLDKVYDAVGNFVTARRKLKAWGLTP